MISLTVSKPIVSGGTASVPVSLFPHKLPRRIIFRGEKFVARKNFDVCLIGRDHDLPGMLQKKRGLAKAKAIRESERLIADALADARILADLYFDYAFIKRDYEGPSHARRTIIAWCFLAGTEGFYSQLRSSFGAALKPVPHHVTLFTAEGESEEGIELATYDDVDRFASIVGKGELPSDLLQLEANVA